MSHSLTFSHSLQLVGSTFSFSMNGLTGQNVSNPLLTDQGWPFCLEIAWCVEEVMSRATTSSNIRHGWWFLYILPIINDHTQLHLIVQFLDASRNLADKIKKGKLDLKQVVPPLSPLLLPSKKWLVLGTELAGQVLVCLAQLLMICGENKCTRGISYPGRYPLVVTTSADYLLSEAHKVLHIHRRREGRG